MRMSQCTSRTSWSARARTRGSQVAVSWRTQSGSSSGGISPARATASAQRWKPSRRSASPPLSASGAGGSGTRSASTWPNRSVSRSRVSIVASSSRSGCVPSTSSSRIATQSPSSYDARRSAQSSCEPMRVSAVTSRRNSSGVFGLSSVPTAFTNARVPSSHTSRVAQPGDMPPTWSAAVDDRRAELVGHPVADVLGHGRPRRPDADCAGAHQPRRSPSHCHSTSPCHRWWSRM